MKEIVPGRSARPSLMRGPDGIVYVVSKGTGTAFAHQDGPAVAGPAIPSAADVANATRVQADLRKKLGYLPQLPVVPC